MHEDLSVLHFLQIIPPTEPCSIAKMLLFINTIGFPSLSSHFRLEEGGVLTDCSIQTQEPDETLDFDFSSAEVLNKIIMKVRQLYIVLAWNGIVLIIFLTMNG